MIAVLELLILMEIICQYHVTEFKFRDPSDLHVAKPKYLRGDSKPYPHNVKLVNIKEHFSQKLLDLDM